MFIGIALSEYYSVSLYLMQRQTVVLLIELIMIQVVVGAKSKVKNTVKICGPGKKKLLSTVKFPDFCCKTCLQTFKLDTTSMQGLIANLSRFFFFMMCSHLHATDCTLFFQNFQGGPLGGPRTWSVRWSMDLVHEVVHVPGSIL